MLEKTGLLAWHYHPSHSCQNTPITAHSYRSQRMRGRRAGAGFAARTSALSKLLLLLAVALPSFHVEAFLVPAARLTAVTSSLAAKTCLDKYEPVTVRVCVLLWSRAGL